MLHFRERGVDVGPGKERVWIAKGCFHEAEIEYDMILRYPLLQENRVAVLSGDNLLRVGEGCQNRVEVWVKTSGLAKGKTSRPGVSECYSSACPDRRQEVTFPP